jgi:hypothetical protein
MRKQRVRLGQMVIAGEAPIDLFADLPCDSLQTKVAALKDRLAYILDTRFRPVDPGLSGLPGLTVEQVAEKLNCRCVMVLRMVKRGQLHPFVEGDDSEPYFDPVEVAGIKAVPPGTILSRLIPRNYQAIVREVGLQAVSIIL